MPRSFAILRVVALPGLLAVAALAAPPAGADKEPFGVLTAAELLPLVGAPDVAIFDANSAEEFARGHVPGAIHLADFRRFPASALPADKATRVIFYCKNTH
jgi:Rhodanese-like domain